MVPGFRRLRDRFDAILIDLDGTLLDADSQVTPRTRRAVQRLRDAGLFVVLCTGRSVAGSVQIYEDLGLDTPLAAYNGSWIGYPDGDPAHYIPIPDAHLDALFDAEREAHFSFRHRAEEKFTIMTDHPEHHQIAAWFQNVTRATGAHELPTSDLLRVSMFFDEKDLHPDDLQQTLWQKLPAHARSELRHEAFPLSLFPAYAGSRLHLFEVQGFSRGKAEALDWLEREHAIAPARTIAVGDHRNDLTMLEAAGLSLTPANGVPEAKALADLVIGHHAEEGLAAWIEAGAPFPDVLRLRVRTAD
jgi:Cof subfamily protein (haloacid dehalogenase superfamily)